MESLFESAARAGSTPRETLRTVFGYPAFRGEQEAIVDQVIAGNDALVLMPTGGGKSLCYQIPALHREGVGIVVSPLISLMKDQVDALTQNGVRAAFFNSSMAAEGARQVLRNLESGALDLLYVAPERLMAPDFLARLRTVKIALFAIDEAHCISQWGHEFRPHYTQLSALRSTFPGVPILALTATADPQTRNDILHNLRLDDSKVFIASFDRPNIRYVIEQKAKPLAQLLSFLDRWEQESVIVYCLARKTTESVADHLADKGFSAAAYHAGLANAERSRVQEGFLRDDLKIVVATIAFGMGIDKPNVRGVVHYNLPKSVEGYYQETGRAGRDGLPSEALLLYGLGDVVNARRMIAEQQNEDQKRIELHKLKAMTGYAEASTCRRQVLLTYFGEYSPGNCGNCDVCLDPPATVDATDDVVKALLCVYQVKQRFAAGHVIDILKGANNERMRRFGHQDLPCFASGADKPSWYWESLLRQLVHRGFLAQDIAQHSALKLTPRTRGPLREGEHVAITPPREIERPNRKRTRDRGSRRSPLFEALRRLRKELADSQGIPPYAVFSDVTLEQIAERRPTSREQFLAVSGVGLVKLEKYGNQFLEVVRAHREAT